MGGGLCVLGGDKLLFIDSFMPSLKKGLAMERLISRQPSDSIDSDLSMEDSDFDEFDFENSVEIIDHWRTVFKPRSGLKYRSTIDIQAAVSSLSVCCENKRTLLSC
eukprot:UN02201